MSDDYIELQLEKTAPGSSAIEALYGLGTGPFTLLGPTGGATNVFAANATVQAAALAFEPTPSVPEPASLALQSAGLLGLTVMRFRYGP